MKYLYNSREMKSVYFHLIVITIIITFTGITPSGSENLSDLCDRKRKPVSVNIEKFHYYGSGNQESEEIIQGLLQNRCWRERELLQTSKLPPGREYHFSTRSFVESVVSCYRNKNKNDRLQIRPEDMWAAVTSQMSFYLAENAEEFRYDFVDFKDKRELTVKVFGTMDTVLYSNIIELMTEEMDKHLIMPGIKKWFMPRFPWTSETDMVTFGVIFMAAMRNYFTYKFSPTIFFKSNRARGHSHGRGGGGGGGQSGGSQTEEIEDILKRLEKLKEFRLNGWYDVLKPVMEKYVKGQAQGSGDLGRIDYKPGATISGWINAFTVFDARGYIRESPSYDVETTPPGMVSVEVLIDDNGEEHKSLLFGGHMAASFQEQSGVVQPTLGWGICLKGDDDDEIDEEVGRHRHGNNHNRQDVDLKEVDMDVDVGVDVTTKFGVVEAETPKEASESTGTSAAVEIGIYQSSYLIVFSVLIGIGNI